MKRIHVSILIVAMFLTVAGTAFAASLAIKCPSVIAIKSLKTFTLSKINMYVSNQPRMLKSPVIKMNLQ